MYFIYNVIFEVFYILFWRQSGTQSSLTGVGLSIGYPNSLDGSSTGLVVISAAPGGPASRAGILPGDIILSIDDAKTDGMGIYDAANILQWVFLHLIFSFFILCNFIM